MIIVLHVVIALMSVVSGALALVAPTRLKLRLTYGLIAATLASGTYLVVHLHAPLVSSCMSGLVYLVVVCALLVPARYRLLAD